MRRRLESIVIDDDIVIGKIDCKSKVRLRVRLLGIEIELGQNQFLG